MRKPIIVVLMVLLAMVLGGCQSSSAAEATPPAQTPTGEAVLRGSWQGTLSLLTLEYDLVVHFVGDGGSIAGTIDIPRQGVTGLELSNVQVDGSHVKFEMHGNMPTAVFEGQFAGDRLFGTYQQSAYKGMFDLQRVDDPALAAQPTASPEAPKPYREEEVRFENGDVSLAGTLTLPETEGPHPAVILISGSGLQDRDNGHYSLPGYQPFRWLADHLTRAGIAVLRYDDRGKGESKGGRLGPDTTVDYSYDTEAALNYLLSRDEIDPEKIGLIGHSEGSHIAALVVSRNEDVAFVVSLAGGAVKGAELMDRQMELSGREAGLPEDELQRRIESNRKEMALIEAQDWDTLGEVLYEETLAYYRALPEDQRVSDSELEQVVREQAASQLESRKGWFHHFVITNPAEDWQHVRVPVLALFGEADTQVDPEQNAPPLQAALEKAGNPDVTIQVIPGADHLFLNRAENGMHNEESIAKGLAPGVKETISGWIAERFLQPE